ncbi:MAG: hypothetical protein BMS9Abin33_1193 [Gammaproteobacteria bacterium]|nr:MAG: hypothetical protein BMS9Abin33_1193 [Gammaproteobacteria bacterium]
MIIHCTQKLAKKLPDVSKETYGETSPLGSWHANLYTIDRRLCVLFCHDATRYTVFIPGLCKPQFVELGRWLQEAFLASLAYMGVEDSTVRRAELALGAVRFDTCTNRSVLGSLNQMKFMLDARVTEVEDVMLLNPLSVTHWLCHYPVNIKGEKGFWMADKAMMERVEKL